jgi:ELWxxDGT repeat protein
MTGTELLKDIKPSYGDSSPTELTNVGGTMFFRADGDDGVELWKSDGTGDGTTEVADINPSGDSVPYGSRSSEPA